MKKHDFGTRKTPKSSHFSRENVRIPGVLGFRERKVRRNPCIMSVKIPFDAFIFIYIHKGIIRNQGGRENGQKKDWGRIYEGIRLLPGRSTHAAGKMAGIQYRDVLKGFGGFQRIVISLADMLCHGDMNDILCFAQPFGEKSFIIISFLAIFQVFQRDGG